jgi:peptidoglycan/LPS O-acetylase OafA/YrhL
MEEVATKPAPTARPRLDHIDGMRATAALIVFVNHAFAQIWNRIFVPPPVFAPWRWFLVLGHLSVTIFIVISGFCLALPVIEAGGILRGGVKHFLRRRARRILPPYYAALALCLLLIATVIGKPTGSLWDVPILVGPTSIVSHVLLLQDLFGTGHINYVFWSIAVEWQIYFLMPLIVLVWRRFGPATAVTGALAFGYAIMLLFAHTRVARMNTHFVGMFTLGMLAAYAARSPDPDMVRLRERFPWRTLALVAAAATAVMAGGWGIEACESRLPYLDLPVGLLATSLLVLASRPLPSRVGRFFSFRPLVFIGTFSYSLYLIHAPLLQILWQFLLRPAHVSDGFAFCFLMTVGLLVVLVCAYGFHLVFEAPFMRAARGVRTAEGAVPVR